MLRTLLTRPATSVLAAVALVLAVTTGCNGGAAGSAPTWVPQPNYQGNNDPRPQLPAPRLPAAAGLPAASVRAGAPRPERPGRLAPAAPATDPNVVATKLNQPTGLVVLPDGTALVGERTTGRILRVQPEPGRPAARCSGWPVDGSGDGGLLDLAHLADLRPGRPGLRLPEHRHRQPGGALRARLATLGDRHRHPEGPHRQRRPARLRRHRRAADRHRRRRPAGAGRPRQTSLAGKILRTSDIGRPLPDNPVPGSRGLRLAACAPSTACAWIRRPGCGSPISAGAAWRIPTR